jgi:ComEC/Rec2-related protein
MFSQLGRIKEFPVLFPLSQYLLGLILGLHIKRAYPAYLFLLCLSLILFISGILWRRYSIKLKTVAAALFFLWLGIFLIGKNLDWIFRRIDIDLSYPRRLEGQIINQPYIFNGKTSFKMRITGMEKSAGQEETSKVRNSVVKVSVDADMNDLRKGESVRSLIRLKRFKAYRIGEKESIIPARTKATPHFIGWLKSETEVERKKGESYLEGVVSTSLRDIRSSIPGSGQDRDSIGVLKGTMIGDRQGLSLGIRRAFRSTGLLHILVVSGFNIGLVFASFFILTRLVLSKSTYLLNRMNINITSTAVAFFPALFYAQLTGLPYPTLRALLMLAIFISCIFISRPTLGLNILFWVGFIITLLDPMSLFDISFQLSFVAVFGIIYGLGRTRDIYLARMRKGFELKTRFEKILSKVKLYFLDLAATSILAFLFTLPISIYYFGSFSTIGIIANLFFVPIFSFLIFPIGLAGMVFAIFGLPLTKLIWLIDLFIIDKTNWFINLFAKIPFSLVKTGEINFILIFFYYALMISALAFVRFKLLKKEEVIKIVL